MTLGFEPRRAQASIVQRFVDLATFAGVNARLQKGVPRDAALRSAGIDPATWNASTAFWLGRMADEAAQQRFGLSQRYAELFNEALRATENAPSAGPRASSALGVAPAHALTRGRR